MKQFKSVFAACVLILAYTTGYAAPQKTSPLPMPPAHAGAPAEHELSSISGKVVETMNAGGYTYVCLEKNGKKTWVAVPETNAAVGQKMEFQPGAEMKNFTSKSLNRTFERIIFSGGPVAKAGGSASADKAAPANHGGSKAAAATPGEKISVEKAAGANAYTVADIYAKKATLHNKTAVVKAKVVKVSAGIMGKNWVHLQDGTGDAAKGTNNLVATSQDLPSVGDVVTMKGTIYKDKDFSSGYKYAVIMEKAKIQR